MSKSLYLYTHPFILTDNVSSRQEHLFDVLTDTERGDHDKLLADLIQFALNEKLITLNEGIYLNSVEKNMGSWVWMINWMDFRNLVSEENYNILMSCLEAGIETNGGVPIKLLVDLHSRLGMLYDHRLLNTLTHRTMSSISLIPAELDADATVMTWEDIHKQSPFLWIIFLMQAAIRSVVTPLS